MVPLWRPPSPALLTLSGVERSVLRALRNTEPFLVSPLTSTDTLLASFDIARAASTSHAFSCVEV